MDISFYRTQDGKEIDFILEYQSKIVAIQLKYTQQIQSNNLKSINDLKDKIPESFYRGIMLCNVKRVIALEEDIVVVPFLALWIQSESR